MPITIDTARVIASELYSGFCDARRDRWTAAWISLHSVVELNSTELPPEVRIISETRDCTGERKSMAWVVERSVVHVDYVRHLNMPGSSKMFSIA